MKKIKHATLGLKKPDYFHSRGKTHTAPAGSSRRAINDFHFVQFEKPVEPDAELSAHKACHDQVQHGETHSIRAKLALIIVVMVSVLMTGGCPEVAEWRDAQIKTSHELAEGQSITIPDPPIAVPSALLKKLPLQDTFTILKFLENNSAGEVTIDSLVDLGADKLSIWLLARMTELGYASGDNASRILEGVTYTALGSAFYDTIYIKVEFVESGKSILRIRAHRN